MARFVPQEFHTRCSGSSLDLEHHFLFDVLESEVGEAKRYSNNRLFVGTQPFVGEITRGMKLYAFGIKLIVQIFYKKFQGRIVNRQVKITDFYFQQLFIRKRFPIYLFFVTFHGIHV
jgi:hypothetical protein